MNKFYLKAMYIYLRYKLGIPVPFVAHIIPTLRCNQNCIYCEVKYNKTPLLPLKYMKKFLKDLSHFNTPLVSMSGGEPLINDATIPAARYAKKLGFAINLNTNGQLINQNNYKKVLEYFDFIRISINGLGNTHDKIVRKKGAYAQVIKNLELLKSAKNTKCKIIINFLIIDNNSKEFDRFYNEFADRVDFIAPIPYFNFSNDNTGIKNKKKMNFDCYCKVGLSEGFLKSNKRYCDAGKLYVNLRHDGHVAACPFKYESFNILGNIKHDSLKEILSSNNFNIDKINCKGCNSVCTTEVSRIFNMGPIRLILNFRKLKKVYMK